MLIESLRDQCHRRSGVYLNNRYHDPTLGSFISVDPLVTMTGEAYIYGAANPTTYSDPGGLDPQCFDSVNASCRYVNHEGKTIATRTTVRDPSTDRTTSTVTHFNVAGDSVFERVQYRGHGGGDYQEVAIGADAGAKALIVPLTSEQGGNRGTLAAISPALDIVLDVARAYANAPRTIPAVLLAEAAGGNCGITSNLGVECVDVPGWALPDTAITLGDAVLTDRSDFTPELAVHENSHRWQQALLPFPAFEIAYVESQVVSVPLDWLRGCRLGSHNLLEVLTTGDGGYGC